MNTVFIFITSIITKCKRRKRLFLKYSNNWKEKDFYTNNDTAAKKVLQRDSSFTIKYFVNINFNNTLIIFKKYHLIYFFNLREINSNILSNCNTMISSTRLFFFFIPSPAVKTYLFSFQARLPSTSVHKFTVSIKASISPFQNFHPNPPSSPSFMYIFRCYHYHPTFYIHFTCLRTNHRCGLIVERDIPPFEYIFSSSARV